MDQSVFARRRRRLMEAIGPEAVAVFPAAAERPRSNDVEHRFRQNSDFHYLTGFPEPGAVCVLQPGHESEEYVLFVRPRDRAKEMWTGRRAGVEGAVADYGASAAYPVEEVDTRLPKMTAERNRLMCAIGRDNPFTRRALRWFEQALLGRQRSGRGPKALEDAGAFVHELRLRKEPEEVEAMRRAAAVSADAHLAAMRAVRAGRWEYEIEGLIEYIFRRDGGAWAAYPSIVASGANAAVLHYTANDRRIGEGEMVLVDAGAEYDLYCADITRTFPVGPAFDGRQRAFYEVVLAAQRAAVEAVRPGARIDEPHRRAVRAIIEGSLAIGLLKGSAAEIEEKELYKPVYMHRTSHWLGIDVHDAGLYVEADGKPRLLEPGMAITVEPGLYASEGAEEVDPAWYGLGVRIEDDVLVTEAGHEVLTAAAPKDIDAIEAIRRDALEESRR